MTAYILRRIVLVPVTLLLLTFIVFVGIRAIPGDAADVRLENATPEQAAALRAELGLDRPWWQEYPRWLADMAQGDLGTSFITDRGITGEIRQRFPVTAELVVLSMLIQVVVGIPLGVLAAAKQNSPVDHGIRLFSIFVLAVPSFWVATLVLILPSRYWGWAPPFGYTPIQDDLTRNLSQFIIPAAINGLFLAAILLRLMRTQMLEVLRQDYIRTARAKGLRSMVVIRRHAIKNAMLPVITFFGLTLANALSGAVILESIFALPGLGTYGVDAVMRRDSTALQGFILVVGLTYVAVNLVIDLSYAKLNPRVSLS